MKKYEIPFRTVGIKAKKIICTNQYVNGWMFYIETSKENNIIFQFNDSFILICKCILAIKNGPRPDRVCPVGTFVLPIYGMSFMGNGC